jgi:hypothetical protein
MDKLIVKHTSLSASLSASSGARRLRAAVVLGVLAVSLAGCVVYPDNGYGYGPGYYAAPVVAPSVVIGGGWGWGGGWGRGRWR